MWFASVTAHTQTNHSHTLLSYESRWLRASIRASCTRRATAAASRHAASIAAAFLWASSATRWLCEKGAWEAVLREKCGRNTKGHIGM